MIRQPIVPTLSTIQAYSIAAISGAVLWMATTALSGRREAWDSEWYWIAAYPVGLTVAGMLGYLAPDRAWRWGLALMLVQAFTLALATNSWGLLPLGLILFAVLAVPPAGAAAIAATVRRRGAR